MIGNSAGRSTTKCFLIRTTCADVDAPSSQSAFTQPYARHDATQASPPTARPCKCIHCGRKPRNTASSFSFARSRNSSECASFFTNVYYLFTISIAHRTRSLHAHSQIHTTTTKKQQQPIICDLECQKGWPWTTLKGSQVESFVSPYHRADCCVVVVIHRRRRRRRRRCAANCQHNNNNDGGGDSNCSRTPNTAEGTFIQKM